MMNHEAGRINGSQDGLTVYKNLDSGFLGAEETETDLVEARSDSQDGTLVFVPEEVLRACVHALHLPRHGIAIAVELARAPNPASRAVLLAKDLIEGLLGGECTFKICPIHL